MITPSVIEYTVTSSNPYYHKVFKDKDLAEIIDTNLKESQKIYNTLKKYYKLKHNSIDRKDYQFTSFEEFIVDNNGKLYGISYSSSSITYDLWDGRPPINNNDYKEIKEEEFIKQYINPILSDIKNKINKLKEITNYKDFSDIVNLAEQKIKEHNNDYKLIKDYFISKFQFKL